MLLFFSWIEDILLLLDVFAGGCPILKNRWKMTFLLCLNWGFINSEYCCAYILVSLTIYPGPEFCVTLGMKGLNDQRTLSSSIIEPDWKIENDQISIIFFWIVTYKNLNTVTWTYNLKPTKLKTATTMHGREHANWFTNIWIYMDILVIWVTPTHYAFHLTHTIILTTTILKKRGTWMIKE